MLRRGYLRSKARGKDPKGNLYAKEVRERRKSEDKPYPQYQPHHIDPPHKKDILWFVLVTREMHSWIHAHANSARAAGWLTNINGSLSVELEQVIRARQRRDVLLQQLEDKL